MDFLLRSFKISSCVEPVNPPDTKVEFHRNGVSIITGCPEVTPADYSVCRIKLGSNANALKGKRNDDRRIRQTKISLALGHARTYVRCVRGGGVVEMSLGIALTALVWLAVIGWFVMLYFYD